ncbi:SSM1, partial [Colletotrichum higginsianum]
PQDPRSHGQAHRPVLRDAPLAARGRGGEADEGVLQELRARHRGARPPPPHRPARLQRKGGRRPAAGGDPAARPRAAPAAGGPRPEQGAGPAVHQRLRQPRPPRRAAAGRRRPVRGPHVLRLRAVPVRVQAGARDVPQGHGRGGRREGRGLFLCRRLVRQLQERRGTGLDGGAPGGGRAACAREQGIAVPDPPPAGAARRVSAVFQIDQRRGL